MKCTILELFNLIVQSREEVDYYKDDCLLEIDDYLQLITSISPKEKKVIISDCHAEPLKETIDVIANIEIEVEGLMLYYFVIHDDEFVFIRINDYEELHYIMSLKLENSFIGDMVVFENGKKKKFCVKDERGIILNYSMMELENREKRKNLIIEWC